MEDMNLGWGPHFGKVLFAFCLIFHLYSWIAKTIVIIQWSVLFASGLDQDQPICEQACISKDC
ncbi:hypothetical protein HKD37_15G042130 [Glycine soja]